jgi:hypothetical protein
VGAGGANRRREQKKVSARRVPFRAHLDTERSNEGVRSGTPGKLTRAAMKQVRPEAAYFSTDEDRRTCFMVFDLRDSSRMPSVAEPFFLELGADGSYTPVMNP